MLSRRHRAWRSAAYRSKRSNSEGRREARPEERRTEVKAIPNLVCRTPGFVDGRIRLARAGEECERDRLEVDVRPQSRRASGSDRLNPRRFQFRAGAGPADPLRVRHPVREPPALRQQNPHDVQLAPGTQAQNSIVSRWCYGTAGFATPSPAPSRRLHWCHTRLASAAA